MKRTFILGAVLVAAMSTASFANDNGDKSSKMALIPAAEDGTYNLIYASDAPGTVKVKVVDEQGHVLRVDKIRSTGGFRQPYNMKDLGPGNYQLLVSDRDGDYTLTARVHNAEEIALNQLGSNRFQLVYKDSKSHGATIGIYDQAGQLVHTEEVKFDNGFSKVFDLSGVTSKGFTFEVSANNSSKRVSI